MSKTKTPATLSNTTVSPINPIDRINRVLWGPQAAKSKKMDRINKRNK